MTPIGMNRDIQTVKIVFGDQHLHAYLAAKEILARAGDGHYYLCTRVFNGTKIRFPAVVVVPGFIIDPGGIATLNTG